MDTKFGKIDQRIIDALGLSKKEYDVLYSISQRPMARNASQISVMTRLPRTTVKRVLCNLERRRIVSRMWADHRYKRYQWKYRPGLERYRYLHQESYN